ncbi:MAG: ABC transporter ATP-binding protein [Myxococcota bacterium]|nr:ABC transporter ATP-binding protein [Myxococcota bacterium]
MIVVESLSRYYGDFAAIENLTFQIDSKEVVGFLGLNGAGKSTTLKILATLLSPSNGKIEIDGTDLESAPVSFRSQIGFLPEEPPLYKEMTVKGFLGHVAQLRGMPPSEFTQRFPTVIEQCHLKGKEEAVINTLSLGYRKRVGIAQAIIHNPKLIILDEPISGLDPLQIAEMRSVIRALSTNATVLLSSHNLNEVSETCDKLLILNNGRLIAQGTTAELASNLSESNIRIEAELVGSRKDIEKHLSEIEAIQSFDVEEEREDSLIVGIALNQIQPETLVPLLVERSIGLRALQNAKSELEEIFISLTKGGSQ